MSDEHAADIDRHVRIYITVFVSLMVLTLITVLANFKLHLSVPATIALALVIASVKASLVACYFMHLISEKKLILWVMLLTVSFFVVLLLVPTFTVVDKIGR